MGGICLDAHAELGEIPHQNYTIGPGSISDISSALSSDPEQSGTLDYF